MDRKEIISIKGWICKTCNVFWNDRIVGGKEKPRDICGFCKGKRSEVGKEVR